MMKKWLVVSLAFISLLLFIVLLLCPFPIVHASVTTNGGNTLVFSAYTETTITVTWTQSSNPNFSGYSLFFCKPQITSSGSIIAPSIGDFTQIWSTGSQSETSTYVDNLSPNTNYMFYLQESDKDSSIISVFFGVKTRSNPQLTITDSSWTTASLEWTDSNTYSSLVPFQSYTIQLSNTGPNGPWQTLTTITNSYHTSYAVIGLSLGLCYVRMFDTVGHKGEVSYSNVVPIDRMQVSVQPSSPTTIELGQQLPITAQPQGGSGSYTYQWYLNSAIAGGETSSSFNFVPSNIGRFMVRVIITDSLVPSANVSSGVDVSVVYPSQEGQTTDSPSPTSTPSIEEFPSLIILTTILIMMTIVAVTIGKNNNKKS